MTDKDRVIEEKEARQKTLDKLSIESGEAYTYDSREKSGCLHQAEDAREERQQKMNH